METKKALDSQKQHISFLVQCMYKVYISLFQRGSMRRVLETSSITRIFTLFLYRKFEPGTRHILFWKNMYLPFTFSFELHLYFHEKIIYRLRQSIEWLDIWLVWYLEICKVVLYFFAQAEISMNWKCHWCFNILHYRFYYIFQFLSTVSDSIWPLTG